MLSPICRVLVKEMAWTWDRIRAGLIRRIQDFYKKKYEDFFCTWNFFTESSYPEPTIDSPFRVCFVSSAGGGAWEIRGEEIASCRRNWISTLNLDEININQFDIFVFVKHVRLDWLDRLKAEKKILVYDIVDGWKQPEDDQRLKNISEIKKFFKNKWMPWGIQAFIFPNRKMWEDLKELVPTSTYIYHRFKPKLKPIAIRKRARVVGYTGEERFLNEWRPLIEKACQKRGLKFVVNPWGYRSVDIAFAARGAGYNSYLSTQYKSNVKLANCYGSATPALFHRERGYEETDNGFVKFFTDKTELDESLDQLLPYEHRLCIHESFLTARKKFMLKTIALEYENFFSQLKSGQHPVK